MRGKRRVPSVASCLHCQQSFTFDSLKPPRFCPGCRTTHRRCSQCKTVKVAAEFYNDKGTRCRECVRGDRLIERTCVVCLDLYRGHAPLKGSPPICGACRPSVKWCPTCDEIKDVESFARSRDKPSGRIASCRACRAMKYREVAGEEREIAAACQRRGITVEQWWTMHDEQGGCCRICDAPLVRGNRPRIDHCHRTGRVRGLLCNRCNLGIGLFADNVESLISAANYLSGGD